MEAFRFIKKILFQKESRNSVKEFRTFCRIMTFHWLFLKDNFKLCINLKYKDLTAKSF